MEEVVEVEEEMVKVKDILGVEKQGGEDEGEVVGVEKGMMWVEEEIVQAKADIVEVKKVLEVEKEVEKVVVVVEVLVEDKEAVEMEEDLGVAEKMEDTMKTPYSNALEVELFDT